MTHRKDHNNELPNDEVVSALEAFVTATEWNEAYDVLEEQEDVLLSDNALTLLQNTIAQRNAKGDPTEELELYLRLLEESRMHGLAAARLHFEFEWRETGKTLISLMSNNNLDDLNKLRSMFNNEQSVLLSNIAVVMLRTMINRARIRGDTLVVESFKDYLQLLEDARSTDVDAAWQNFERRKDQQAYENIDILTRYTSVSSWEEAYSLLKERQDVLLSDIALAYLQMQLTELRANGNALASQKQEHLVHLVENARISGVDSAWENFRRMLYQPMLPGDLSLIMGEVNRLTKPLELPRKIELLSQALSVAEHEGETHLRALLLGLRGTSYIDRQTLLGDDNESIERAIGDLDAALSFFTREAFPDEWADTHRARGIAYTMRVQGDLVGNLEQAIDDYDAALTILSSQADPLDWAKVLLRRGDAYAARIAGDRRQNLEQAIFDFSTALTVFTRETFPLDWAESHKKRGIIYSQRINGDQTKNIELAIADYDAALEVFAREEYPIDWANAHMGRGIAYRKRLRGNWAENIELAIADLNAALEIFTREAFLIDWATTHMNRGIIYHARVLGERAENIELAIRDYEAALEVFTNKTHPNECAITHTNLGSAYIDRIFGKGEENLERAIQDFDLALDVHRREVSPFSWANAHMGRGIAYRKRLRGNWAENIELAIADLNAALEIFTREAFPTDWAKAHMNRGNAYSVRVLGERAENIELAIRDYEAALEVFSREAFPIDWAQVHDNQAGTYQNRIHGSRSENLEQAIADYNAALQVFTRDALPIYWAQARRGRARIYEDRIRGGESENLERALEDYNAALEVLTHEALPQEWAAVLVNRGHVYRRSTRGDRAENLEQVIADYNSALEVFTRDVQPIYWARTKHDRGIAYMERVLGDRALNIEQAIVDFNAPLEVFTQDTSPMEWARAHLSRSDAYKDRVLGARKANLERASKDSDAALEVFTREALPRDCRDAQLKRAQILESQGRLQEAHLAFVAVRETIDLLLEIASTDIERAEVLSERSGLDFNLIDAQVLLKCVPPDLAVAACALEAGRAQILRRVLDLDTLTTTHISDHSAQRRIEAFLAARDTWREAQRLLTSSLPVELSSNERGTEVRHRRQRLEVAYAEFTQARDAIRQYDNPDFLVSEVTLEGIGCAIPSNDTALIYLVAGEESGIVLIITRDSVGAPQVQHIPLPHFTQNATGDLFLTRVLRIDKVGDKTRQRELVVGGLSMAQMDVAFEFLPNWGESLREVIATLPHDCSFYAVAQLLVDALTASPIQQNLPDQPFNSYSETQHSRIASAFNRAVLNIELEKSLRTLGELGLGELAQVLYKQGIHKIILIPYRGLSLFPLSAVRVSFFERSTQRMGDIFEVTISPSARGAQVAHERAVTLDRVKRPLLLTAGDPEPLPPGVPRLPYAQAEAEATYLIAKGFNYSPNTIRYLRPREATKVQIVKSIEQAWYAQLAVHGTYQADEPRNSHLMLAGNESVPETERGIYLGEALNGTVNLVGLRLLILSACETARIDMSIANETLGLATGFLQAGAAGVIASLWAVDDQATYLLISRFAQFYLDPQRNWSPARALAEAQRWLREEATNRVIATYNPAQPVSLASTSPSIEKSPTTTEALLETTGELMTSRARSLRYSHSSALIEMHAQAAKRAEIAPDALPYADPIYWAAFFVTGC